jgi:hypothetical protein
VSLSCYNCANPVATALSPSGGCYTDIQIYVSYGGYLSAAFNVFIDSPTITYIQSGYPMNANLYYMGYPGYSSTYVWAVADACNYTVGGIDANEVLGTDYPVYTNENWTFGPTPPVYMSTYLIGDEVASAGNQYPPPMIPQMPLTTTVVHYDYPWALRVGSQTSGSGSPVRVDHQQWWLDHGTHY